MFSETDLAARWLPAAGHVPAPFSMIVVDSALFRVESTTIMEGAPGCAAA
jgi:hypothetical protein